jgi:hypothetical protein
VNRHEVSRKLIEATIGRDDDDRRFEKFTADLFSSRDGISYETTAPTGDGGVDARAPVRLVEGVAVVCATVQRKGFKTKAIADIDKNVASLSKIVRLHVCFGQDVKEETLQEVRKYAVSKLPHADIEVHGRTGLSDIAFRYQGPFLDNYRRELEEHTLWLLEKSDEHEDPNQVNLLRIAVTTVFHPEIIKQRELLLESLVVTALSSSAKSVDEIAVAVAEGLKLQRAPQKSFLLASIASLEVRGIIEKAKSRLRLTSLGYNLRDQLVAQGVSSSLDARAAFFRLLGELPSNALTADEFSRLWRTIQLRLSKLFLHNGLRVVEELQAIAADGNTDASPAQSALLSSAIHGILDEIENLRLNERVSKRIAEVLRQMLTNSKADAFQWLSELGVKYVVICSLGLDPELERRIRERVASWVVIPDTHVILSYLCVGDEGHDACDAILKQLHHLGGTIWAMEPVVEEAIHHAVIADASFRDWNERIRCLKNDYPDLNHADVLQQTDNAFVKGFAHVAAAPIKQSDWFEYIQQFRGVSGRDPSILSDALAQELNCEYKQDLPEVAEVGRAFAKTVLHADEREVSSSATLRCEWDGRLLASTVLYRKLEPVTRRFIIASDSDRLRHFLYKNVVPERRYGLKIADPSSIACALAMVPGTSANLNCVRHFLFNGNISLPGYLYESNKLAEAFRAARVLRNPALRDRLDAAMLQQSSGSSGTR